jgi:hypothetical protein
MHRMTSRREFLQIGIAASTLPLASQAARAAGIGDLVATAHAGSLPLYKVVYDTRFPESVAFGRRAAALGAQVHAIDGDMTRLWFDDIYHRWQQAPVAIAGLTAHGSLFCFERLAWDQGLRVVFRAEHGAKTSGSLMHVAEGPRGMLGGLRAALERDDWSVAMADVVMRCPSGKAEVVSFGALACGTTATLETDSLYSWVIAPAVRA